MMGSVKDIDNQAQVALSDERLAQVRDGLQRSHECVDDVNLKNLFADAVKVIDEEVMRRKAKPMPIGYIDAEYADLISSGHIESCLVYTDREEGSIPVYILPPA